jgi:hypothetical protein
MTVNASRDGGRTWGPPVRLQAGPRGRLDDDASIVVDNGQGLLHHRGRVYVVRNRAAHVLTNYCDHDCDRLENWLPDFQAIPNVVFAGQAVAAYPVIQVDGGFGIVMDTLTGPGANELVYIAAPTAGRTRWPEALAFTPPIPIASNGSGRRPSAAVDTSTGTIYTVWGDGRYRADGANDVVMSRSFDNGIHWTLPQRVNQDSTTDHVEHSGAVVAVGAKGTVHVAYRTPGRATHYQESFDYGETFTRPLTLGGDAAIATAGGYTYLAHGRRAAVVENS